MNEFEFIEEFIDSSSSVPLDNENLELLLEQIIYLVQIFESFYIYFQILIYIIILAIFVKSWLWVLDHYLL